MKKLSILVLLVILQNAQAQKQTNLPYEFGKAKPEEISMKEYLRDPSANALVLYEHSNVSFHGDGSYNHYFVNTIYKRIKIFNEKGYDHGTVKIYLYKSSSGDKERLKNLKAITYNAPYEKTVLEPEQIFEKSYNDLYDEVTFTFPNLKPGSVIEYQYDIKSEFYYNLVGWNFQSDIPKVYSQFHAIIPGFWNYNRHLNGSLRLTENKSEVINHCYEIRGAKASCENLTYTMTNIPAFKLEEKYSTAKKNHIAKIEFELSRVNRPDGSIKEYTTTWSEADKVLKEEQSVGKQLKLQSSFKKLIPKEILKIKDDNDRAMVVFYHIQDHFSLNSDSRNPYSDVRVKKAYEEKAGSVAEINLALVNALKAAGLKSHPMLISTRDNGVPTKQHPVLNDFNYALAVVEINENKILLDASDKYVTFGQTPFKTLNGVGRVLDFENGSYWLTTNPKVESMELREIKLKMDEEGLLSGEVTIKSKGYDASYRRQRAAEVPQDDLLEFLGYEDSDIFIDKYRNQNLSNLDSIFVEKFEIEAEMNQNIGEETFLNPFLYRYENNPFQLENRNYPVNFGYKLNDVTKTSIRLPEGYVVKSMPKEVIKRLPNNGGFYKAVFSQKENEILIYSNLQLNYPVYNAEKYKYLKEMFKEIIKTNNSLISLTKTSGS
ncbi:DUF3857 domain-containing protein [Lutimonas saemankumensis]|uniref:DUF3857 domain-containing protein n=1 Tax=Lutimonas saemankumensis TaxID=483016 RepID=UPI001CD28371|nr:DUF3857 domain-containing protein [Lutimonas saemankumensis]MCA0931504.1 DUF3857 domain-containing protein [Lutimonas saemankumensis]